MNATNFEKEVLSQTAESKEFPHLYIREWGQTFADFNYREKPFISSLLRIGYIDSGSGFITVNNHSYKLEAGDTYIIHPGDCYYYDSNIDNPMNKLWTHFSGSLITKILSFYNIEKLFYFKDTDSYEQIAQIHKICVNYSNPYNRQSRASIHFFKFIQFLAQQTFKNKAGAEISDRIKLYIDLHITENISTYTLSDISKLSKDHTIRIFKDKFGLTPHQYILERKTQLAKYFLQATNCSIDEIASELGFCDGTHFSYTFAQRTGIRPSKYRKNLK